MWLLQTNEQSSRLSFPQQCVGSGAASLSAAHVRKMWRSAKRDLFDMFCFRNPLPLFIFAKTFNSWRHQKVGKGGFLSCESSSNIARVGVRVVNQWWIRIIFRRTFSVPKICPRSFQATHACHSEVSNRCFGLWSPRPFVSIFRCRPHVSMESEQKPRSNKNLSRFSF